MILDGYLLFTGGGSGIGNGDGATDSPTTGTQVSSNVIDLGLIGIPSFANGGGARDIGIGDDPAMKLMVTITTVFAGSSTLAVILQGAPDNGSGAPGTYVTMYTGATVAAANLQVGVRLADIDIPRPVPTQPLPRFLRLEFVNGGTSTSGAVEGAIVLDRSDQIRGTNAGGSLSGYPAGINVAN
jgi:hypothetical protein